MKVLAFGAKCSYLAKRMTLQENVANKRVRASKRAAKLALAAEGHAVIRPRELKGRNLVSMLDNTPLTQAEVTRLAAIGSRIAMVQITMLAKSAKNEAVRLKAGEILLDRAFGKANQPISGEISVVESLGLDDREKLVAMLSGAIIEHDDSPPGPPAFIAPKRDKAP